MFATRVVVKYSRKHFSNGFRFSPSTYVFFVKKGCWLFYRDLHVCPKGFGKPDEEMFKKVQPTELESVHKVGINRQIKTFYLDSNKSYIYWIFLMQWINNCFKQKKTGGLILQVLFELLNKWILSLNPQRFIQNIIIFIWETSFYLCFHVAISSHCVLFCQKVK